MPITRNSNDTWEVEESSSAETFWASYTDLMAGLLMIFALTTMLTLLDIGKRLVEPTRVVQEWKEIVDEICHDQDLGQMENVAVRLQHRRPDHQ